MRIMLIAGHGNGDCGAIGNGYQEANLTRELVDIIATKLNDYADVQIFDKRLNLYTYLKSGNSLDYSKIDFAIEIHFNSVNDKTARGTEILCKNATDRQTEKLMIERLVNVGFKNRGIKFRNDLQNMNLFHKNGVKYCLVETCFISNCDDMKIYQANKEEIANAIASAVIDTYGLTEKVKLLTSANDITWELNHTYFPISELNNFKNALQRAKDDNSPLYWGFYKLANKIK